MNDTPNKDEQKKAGDELLKRLLKTPPKPHKDKDGGPARKPDHDKDKPK